MKHFIIPDTQCRPGTGTRHLTAAGNYIVDKQPEIIVHLGDHWDMRSLSDHEELLGREGLRYWADIQAGVDGMEALTAPIIKHNKGRRKKYRPRMVFLIGNHEQRIERYVKKHPEAEGQFTYDHFRLREFGWQCFPFLQPVRIHGIYYAHYFYVPETGRAYGGRAPAVLNSLGFSFTAGHRQGKDIAAKSMNNGKTIRGLIAGSFYSHNEEYKGPQANDHWRGCLMKHEVRDGNYDLLELSLDYLLRAWA